MWEELWEAGLNQGGANNSVQDCRQFWAVLDTTCYQRSIFFALHGIYAHAKLGCVYFNQADNR